MLHMGQIRAALNELPFRNGQRKLFMHTLRYGLGKHRTVPATRRARTGQLGSADVRAGRRSGRLLVGEKLLLGPWTPTKQGQEVPDRCGKVSLFLEVEDGCCALPLAQFRPRLSLDFFNQKEKIRMGKTQIGSRNTMMFDVWRYVLVVWMRAGKPWVIWVWK